ncbi:MAG: permease [Gammaproteobacteria bacterium]|jgi:uncharacterized membrane protein YraQ (UPF0718 family)
MTEQQHARNPNRRTVKGGWVFFGMVVAVYIITAIVNINTVKASLILFIDTLQRIIPTLLLVFILMALLNLVLDAQRAEAYVGKTSGPKGWLLALVGGILATGPVFSWYIFLGELKQKGMKTPLIAVFLYSRAVKAPLLPLMVHYFGMGFTIVLSVYLVVFSILSGLVTGRLVDGIEN